MDGRQTPLDNPAPVTLDALWDRVRGGLDPDLIPDREIDDVVAEARRDRARWVTKEAAAAEKRQRRKDGEEDGDDE